MTTPDFRAELQALLNAIHELRIEGGEPTLRKALDRARAALAVEAVGPSDQESLNTLRSVEKDLKSTVADLESTAARIESMQARIKSRISVPCRSRRTPMTDPAQLLPRLQQAYVCCKECGLKWGVYSVGCSSSYMDTCDVCGEHRSVTETRDYAYLVTGRRKLAKLLENAND